MTKRIIYIEDDLEMIDLVKMILSRKGYDIVGAHGGQQGLDQIEIDKPDLILLDLMMPDIDGWNVYQYLKSNKATKQIPVIVITAKAQSIDRVLGIQIAKVDDYITKPFRSEELISSIEKLLGVGVK